MEQEKKELRHLTESLQQTLEVRGLVDQEAGELVGPHDTVFSSGVSQRVVGKRNGHQEALI